MPAHKVKNPKNKLISVKVSEVDCKRISKISKKKGKAPSTYMRELALEEFKKEYSK